MSVFDIYILDFGIHIGFFGDPNFPRVKKNRCSTFFGGPIKVRSALQTGCVANVVATKFIVFVLFLFSPPYYFSLGPEIRLCTYGKTR
jgi:hypothetical protein